MSSMCLLILVVCLMAMFDITCTKFTKLPNVIVESSVDIKTRHEQCRNITSNFEGACKLKPEALQRSGCLYLVCAVKNKNGTGHRRVYGSARPLDGTYCGESMFCFEEECIPVPNGVTDLKKGKMIPCDSY